MGGPEFASVILTISGFLSWQPESGQGPPAPLTGTCQTTRDGVKHILDVGTAGVLPDTGEDSLRPCPIPVASDGRFWRCWSLVQVGVTSPRPCSAGGPSGEGTALGEQRTQAVEGPDLAGLSGPLLTAVWLLGYSQPLNQFSSFV